MTAPHIYSPEEARALRSGSPSEQAGKMIRAAIDLTHSVEHHAAEATALRAIVEGRTAPPTDEEALAHDRAGGRWLVLRASRGSLGRSDADFAVFGLGVAWISPTPTDDFPGVERVWALDSNGRPCAWPVAAEPSR